MTSHKYDFFILQSSTAAGKALNEFLREHPEIHMPARHLVDLAFERHRDDLLIGPKCFPTWPNSYKAGFLLHSRVQLEERIPHSVSRFCNDRLFMQLVRNPLDVIKASHKRYIQINIFKQVANQLGVNGYQSDVPLRTPHQVYEWLKPRLLYFEQGQRFAGNFKHQHVIDGSELWPEKVEATMKTLYGLIGVDTSFNTPLFRKDFHGLFQRVLEFSGMNISLYGFALPIHLCVDGGDDQPAREELDPPPRLTLASRSEDFVVLGGDKKTVKLSMVTAPSSWLSLPVKLRTFVSHNEDLNAILAEQVLPRWRGLYNAIREEIDKLRVDDLPDDLVKQMKHELGPDLDQLFRLRPQLEELWPTWSAAA